MKKFYFVGGPVPGGSDEFFRRLAEVGGAPDTWQIYPHASHDGKALHIAEEESQDPILNHLRHFQDIYQWSEIIEVIDPRDREGDGQQSAAE